MTLLWLRPGHARKVHAFEAAVPRSLASRSLCGSWLRLAETVARDGDEQCRECRSKAGAKKYRHA